MTGATGLTGAGSDAQMILRVGAPTCFMACSSGHMNVRPSNTEPLLRLNLEARSQALMEAKRDEVLALMRA